MHPMAFTVGEREVRPLVADEVLRMEELGILEEDAPVELLDGALVEVSPKGLAHEEVKIVLTEWLASHAATGGFRLGVEVPMRVARRDSLPEPDLSLLPRGRRLDYADLPLLVIEVAVSSLRTDTRFKARLYAATGVPELWIVEPNQRRVHVYEDPTDDGFGRVTVLTEADRAELIPRHVAVPPLPLATLFADL